MEENARELAEFLRVLANENRLLILCALSKEPMTVSMLGEYVPGITQSALSQHLAMLKAHKILDSKKTGLNITYFIADHRVEDVMQTLKRNYCAESKKQ